MKIYLATLDDLDQIWSLRLETTELLKYRKIDQWQFRDPSHETFIKDILNKEFYVVKDESGLILGMMSLKEGVEHTYNIIYDGFWRFKGSYLTIHRLAVKRSLLGEGVAKILMAYSEEVALKLNTPYIRIDTHEKNKYAIRLFESYGYVYCGWINLEQEKGDLKRLAYDKRIGNK